MIIITYYPSYEWNSVSVTNIPQCLLSWWACNNRSDRYAN